MITGPGRAGPAAVIGTASRDGRGGRAESGQPAQLPRHAPGSRYGMDTFPASPSPARLEPTP